MSRPAPLPSGMAAPDARGRRWMPVLADGLSIAQYARSLERRLSLMTAVLVTAIWALSGRGYFWPAWVWLGLGALVLLDHGAAWAWSRQPGAVRRVSCVWTVVAVAAAILIATWLLTWQMVGVDEFWPAWALLGLMTGGSTYSLIALHDRVLVARGRRALRARIDMLTSSRRQAVDAQAAELRRIERDLHDGAQARLVALTLQLGRAEMRVKDQPEVRGLILDAQREASQAISELRNLARGIVPPLLADRGLTAAVESLAARYGLGTAVESRTHRKLAPAVESAAYFVIAEALTNTAKHSGARRSWVRIAESGRLLEVSVGDDGCGGADAAGSGLAGLRARVQALDGRLTVTSAAGEGTLVAAVLPCG